MQNNLHASTSYNFRNMQHVNSNTRASATPEIHMPMNSMVSLINKYETLDVIIFLIAYKQVFHLYIHRQIIHNMWVHLQTGRWTGKLAMLLLAIWPIIINHHMLHIMLIIFHRHMQLGIFIIRIPTITMVIAE
jgi:hypothetical protein